MSYHILHVPDSFELIKGLDDDACDVTITDPPFDAHCHANQSSGTAIASMVREGKKGGIPRITPEFAALSNYAFCLDLLRITRRWVLVWCTVEAFGEIKALVGDAYIRGCIWYKPNSMGQLTGDRPACAYEGVVALHKHKKKQWNGRGSFALWTCNGTRGEKDRHPNQKPLALCQKLVALFSNEGETIFDPFCGSGRIGQAATSLGRNYIGLDFDAEWIAKAQERMALVHPIIQEQALALCLNRGEKIDGGDYSLANNETQE